MENYYNTFLLASICNNTENTIYYYIDKEGKCFYKDKFIGHIKVDELRLDNDSIIQDIYFQPIEPMKSINVTFNILQSKEQPWE